MRRNPLIATIGAVCVLGVAVAGFFVYGRSKAVTTVSLPDSTGAFHFYVPARWQRSVSPGVIAVYAADRMPEDEQSAQEALKTAPSLIVFTTEVESTTPVPDELLSLVRDRAKARGWRRQDVGGPEPATIGKRAASKVLVRGTDADGTDFAGAFYLVRTSRREVFVAALAVPEKWEPFRPQLDRILREWYWQLPDDAPASGEATGGPGS